MELFKDILFMVLKEDKLTHYRLSVAEIIDMECYKALREIKSVIENGALTDSECFQIIEEIVMIFERIGSNGGNRHKSR